MHSTVLIIPAAMKTAGNAVAEAMGWGPNNYSVPVSASGSGEPTHFGLHTWATDTFKGWLEKTIPLPESMETAQPVIDALIFSFEAYSDNHFSDVLGSNNLQLISEVLS